MSKTMAYSGLLLFFFVMVVPIPLAIAQLSSIGHYSYGNHTNYASSSLFAVNLKISLSTLYANAHNNRFYQTSTGQSPEKAYSLFLCAGYLSRDLCERWVKTSGEYVTFECAGYEDVVIWFDHCMLRYSNRSIFSVMDESPFYDIPSKNNVSTDPHKFKANLEGLMRGLVKKVKSSRDFLRGYGLMQCTPDISPDDCSICLNRSVTKVLASFHGEKGRKIFKPSCNVRFEIYRFYKPNAAARAAPASVTP